MNIVITGCGNIGFETARLLAGDHTILILDIRQLEYLKDLSGPGKDVTFERADATSTEDMEHALDQFRRKHRRIDALISTVGAWSQATPMDNSRAFRRNFELNYLGNLVPVKCVIEEMMAAREGTLIVISSVSGHFSLPELQAYTPAKWAIEHTFRSLRSELKPFGVAVEVISPTSLCNEHSETFTIDPGKIRPVDVARKITGILKRPRNTSHFIPERIRAARPLERLYPAHQDRKSGLKPQRQRQSIHKKAGTSSALIIGATSGPGQSLTYAYARSISRLCLVGQDGERLERIREGLAGFADCSVETVCMDMADCASLERFTAASRGIDMVISAPEMPAPAQVKDVSPETYRHYFDLGFFGPASIITGLLLREDRPRKIISLIPLAAISGAAGGSTCSPFAALWSYTRSLRRMYANDVQIMEAMYSCPARNGDSFMNSLAAKVCAVERNGGEFMIFPPAAKLSYVVDALLPELCASRRMKLPGQERVGREDGEKVIADVGNVGVTIH